jgi:hypothetical protein
MMNPQEWGSVLQLGWYIANWFAFAVILYALKVSFSD